MVKTVNEYIDGAPKEVREKLGELRTIIKACAPKAEEKISYGMPYFGYKGRLVYFAYAKNHIGLYVMPKYLEDFEKDVVTYRTGKSTLRFPLNKELPSDLIQKILKQAVKKIETGL